MHTEQLCLDLVPNFRNTDPRSSADAGEKVVRSGRADIQRKQTLQAVKLYPGHTSKELSSLVDMDRYALARRLPELLRADLVTRTEDGECKWYPK